MEEEKESRHRSELVIAVIACRAYSTVQYNKVEYSREQYSTVE
jgi:coenzyme F420-reducing hydrogenase gamma subunit